MPENSIQNNLFEYFKDNETFTLREANEAVLHHFNRDVKIPSIRARIYEGIDKGLFKRVAKGVYTVTKNDSTCMVINGDGRDLSFIKSQSIDCIITDHPYKIDKSQKGGNRKIGKTYDDDKFEYNEADMKEKQRVLKPGGFLVEMLPERNADNLQYLNKVIELATDVGLEFYAVVPWKKGDSIINQGRKSKNTEDIYFFTNGKARSLRTNVKAMLKAKEEVINNIFEAKTDVIVNPTNLMGVMGAGLAKQFRDNVPGLEGIYKVACAKRERESTFDGFQTTEKLKGEIITGSHQTMFQGDLMLFEDPVCRPDGPRVLCFPTKRHWKEGSDLDLIEQGLQTFVENYEKFNIKSITFPKLGCGLGGLDWEKDVAPLMHKYLDRLPIQVEVCGEVFQEKMMSGTRGMLPTVFDIQPPGKKERIHEHEKPVELYEKILEYTTLPGEIALDQFAGAGGLGKAALNLGRDSILIEKNDIFCHKLVVSLEPYGNVKSVSEQVLEQVSYLNEEEPWKTLDCSVNGDKRFNSLYAMITIKGENHSIQEFYRNSLRTAYGEITEDSKRFDHIIDPFTGDKLPPEEAINLYKGLWITYLSKNPDLVEYASGFDEFYMDLSDKNIDYNYALLLSEYVKDPEFYTNTVRKSDWYQNIINKKKPSLENQIKEAKQKETEQMSFFGDKSHNRWENIR